MASKPCLWWLALWVLVGANSLYAADHVRVSPREDPRRQRQIHVQITDLQTQLDSVASRLSKGGSIDQSRLLLEQRREITSNLKAARELLAELQDGGGAGTPGQVGVSPNRVREDSPDTEALSPKSPSGSLSASRPSSRKLKSRSYNLLEFNDDVSVDRGEVVHGDAIVFHGELRVEGLIEGDAITVGGDLHLGRTSRITGQAVALGGNIIKHPRAQVEGRSVSLSSPLSLAPQGITSVHGWALVLDVLKLGFLALLAGLLLAAIPDRLALATAYLHAAFLRCFGVGLLALLGGSFALAVCVMILMITIVGIPLALLILVLMFVVLVVSLFVGVFLAGDHLRRWLRLPIETPLVSVLVGLLLLLLPELIADLLGVLRIGGDIEILVGILSMILITALSASGLGSMVLTQMGKRSPTPEAAG